MLLRLRTSHRVVMVVLTALGAGSLLVGLVLARSGGPADHVSELGARVLPIEANLDEVRGALLQAQDAFLAALQAPSPEARAQEIALSDGHGKRATEAWNSYKRIAIGLPGERSLQDAFDRLARRARDTAVKVFTSDPASDPTGHAEMVAQERDLSAGQVALAARIRDEMYRPLTRRLVGDIEDGIEASRRDVPIAFGVLCAVGLLIATFALRGARLDERDAAERDRERSRDLRRTELETQLQRGLEMEASEEATYRVITDALRQVLGDRGAELLVADSSRAHFRQVLHTDEAFAGCPVGAPSECPAANSGQTRVFASSERLDACPYLRNRVPEPLSAVCVPVSIAGNTIGVLHTTAPVGDPVSLDSVHELELVARKAGDRIGVLRVLARTETQAQVDALTGLVNRRTLENEGHRLVESTAVFCVLFADLDHFKAINDVHGHETGDRALRLFARVLRDSVRPNDVPGRFGGEEFVILLPDCFVTDARVVAERVRERLDHALSFASVPPFTVSIGIAPWEPGEALGETVARADEALLYAKRTGRDKVVVIDEVVEGQVVQGEAAPDRESDVSHGSDAEAAASP